MILQSIQIKVKSSPVINQGLSKSGISLRIRVLMNYSQKTMCPNEVSALPVTTAVSSLEIIRLENWLIFKHSLIVGYNDFELIDHVFIQGNVFLWNISTSGVGGYTDLQAEATFAAHKRYCLKVLLSPDVRLLATCSADTTIKIWSLTPNQPPKLDKTLYDHQRWVWDLAFSADSAYLVSASSDHSARLWELASGQTVRQYSGHSKPCVAVALNDINVV